MLGFPCNQFGAQEPGTSDDIREFCDANYQISFPMYERVEVNGTGAHPLFVELKNSARGLLGTRRIKWNFTKFLVDAEGRVLQRYAPNHKPAALAGRIAALLDLPG